MTDTVIDAIDTGLKTKDRIIVAIDGRCGAGKTTLAAAIREKLDCVVIHMDSFFLRPEQRTPERLSEPGGNIDRERFLEEVLKPFAEGLEISYRPFDCKTMRLLAAVKPERTAVTIVEGTYSCHPVLRNFYDIRVFLTTSPEEQLKRIAGRSPEKLDAFMEKWIPLEERYFSLCEVREACGLVFET